MATRISIGPRLFRGNTPPPHRRPSCRSTRHAAGCRSREARSAKNMQPSSKRNIHVWNCPLCDGLSKTYLHIQQTQLLSLQRGTAVVLAGAAAVLIIATQRTEMQIAMQAPSGLRVGRMLSRCAPVTLERWVYGGCGRGRAEIGGRGWRSCARGRGAPSLLSLRPCLLSSASNHTHARAAWAM